MTARIDVAAVVEEAIAVLRGSSPASAAEVERVRAETPPMPTVVVVGETKRGKSSLVNAVLNAPGLSPVDPQAATSAYLVFTHGAADGASAQLPGSTQVTRIPLPQLREWATTLGTLPADQARPRVINVECRSPLLRNLTLIDTPGVGGLDSAHGEIAMHAVRRATALLFVVDASAPFSEPELAFLHAASESVDLVFFAVAKIDAFRGWRQIIEADRALLRQHASRFAGAHILPISSRLFDQARTCETPALAEALRLESHVIELQVLLQQTVAAAAHGLCQANQLRAARTLLSLYFRDLEVRAAAVDPDPSEVARLRADREALIASRRAGGRSWSLKLRADISRARTDAIHRVAREMREANAHWRARIERAGRSEIEAIPRDLDAALQAQSLRLFDGVIATLRDVADGVLRDTFSVEEIEEVYADLVRNPAFGEALTPPPSRPHSVEEKIVLFGGITAGLSAGRLIGYLPAMIGAGVAGTVLAPVSMGLGVVLTAWMVHSRQHVADKNHLRQWLGDVLGEAKAVLDAELTNQFTDAEHALTIALDTAVTRQVERVDDEIRGIDAALHLDAQHKEGLRRDLGSRQAEVRHVLAKVDAALAALRANRVQASGAP